MTTRTGISHRLATIVVALALALTLVGCFGSLIAPDIEEPSRKGYAILDHAEKTLATHPDAQPGGSLEEALDEVRHAKGLFQQINRLSLREGEEQR